jgi:hypothetical protein
MGLDEQICSLGKVIIKAREGLSARKVEQAISMGQTTMQATLG